MANITPAFARVRGENSIDGWQVIWNPLTTANPAGVSVGSPLDGPGQIGLGQLAGYADKSLAFSGTFQTSTPPTIVLEGSNDGVNFFPLSNPLGTILSFATQAAAQAQMWAITEAVIQVRPRITSGGDAGTAIVVTMFFRKTQVP